MINYTCGIAGAACANLFGIFAYKYRMPLQPTIRYRLPSNRIWKVAIGNTFDIKSFEIPNGQCPLSYTVTIKQIFGGWTTYKNYGSDDGINYESTIALTAIGPIGGISYDGYRAPNQPQEAQLSVEGGARKINIGSVPNTNYYFYRQAQIISIQRTDGTSKQEDVAQCGSLTRYTLTIKDCQNKITFKATFNERPEIDLSSPLQYGGWQYKQIPVKLPLGYINIFRANPLNEQGRKCIVLQQELPLINLPIGPAPKMRQLDQPFKDYSKIILDKICSPICATEYPQVCYACINDKKDPCDQKCPPQTTCKVQTGNIICCFDAKGNLIGTVKAGCEKPDCTCN